MRRVLLRPMMVATLIVGILFPVSVQAQKAKSDFGLNLNVFGNVYASRSRVDQPLPDDWASNFYPQHNMTLNKNNGKFAGEIGLGLEPTWEKNNFTIGLPIFYGIGLSSEGFSRDLKVAGTSVNWWDKVSVLTINLRKTAPAIGLSLQKAQWKIQGSIQPYTIFVVDYRGVDVYGGHNYSKEIDRKQVGSGVGQRLTLYRLIGDTKDEWSTENRGFMSVNAFYERNGSQIWLMGIGLNYAYSIK